MGSRVYFVFVHRQISAKQFIIQRRLQNPAWNESADDSSHRVPPPCCLYPNLYRRMKKVMNETSITFNSDLTCRCHFKSSPHPDTHTHSHTLVRTLHVWELTALICTALTFHWSVRNIRRQTRQNEDISTTEENRESRKLACHVGKLVHLQVNATWLLLYIRGKEEKNKEITPER